MVNITQQTEGSNNINPAAKKYKWRTTNVDGIRWLHCLMWMIMFDIQISYVCSSQHSSATNSSCTIKHMMIKLFKKNQQLVCYCSLHSWILCALWFNYSSTRLPIL